MIQFDFLISERIIFSRGAVASLAQTVKSLEKTNVLLVNGAGATIGAGILSQLKDAGIKASEFVVHQEPEASLIENGVKVAISSASDCIIGLGGGSAMDTAKAISVLCTNTGNLLDYLEVVGLGKPIIKPGLPLITVPTTAGTGSEVTRNAVIGLPEQKVKVSLRSPHLMAKVALIDPELTLSLPREVTAWTGMDALTQLIEAYVTKKTNTMTDTLCREGIAWAARSLKEAFQNPQSYQAREGMSWASLLSGMALANAGLGAVHGFAGPIGGMFAAAHGAICASLLPAVIEMNARLLEKDSPKHPVLEKYQEIARLVCQNPRANISDGLKWIYELRDALMIPRLSDFGVRREQFNEITEKAMAASSMKGNPVNLTREHLIEILECSF